MDHRCSSSPNKYAMADITAFGMTVWMPHSDPSSYSFSCIGSQWNHGCQSHHRWLPKEFLKLANLAPSTYMVGLVSTSDPRNHQATKPRAASLFLEGSTHDNGGNHILDKWAQP